VCYNISVKEIKEKNYMIKLRALLETLAPKTKIYVYNRETFKFDGGAAAEDILIIMQKEGTDGIVKSMTVGAGRVNLYLQKLD